MRRFAIALSSAGLFTALTPATSLSQEKAQGIEGTVYKVEGNRMPSPDRPPAPPAGTRATVCVFELTGIGKVDRQGQSPWYTAVRTKLMAETETNENGRFTICLSPGVYSLFIKKGPLYYANRFDSHNNIAPVKVYSGKMTHVECRVETGRKAVY